MQQTRFACGTRKITSIVEVTGVESGKIQLQEVFAFVQTGINAAGKTQGYFTGRGFVPEFYDELNGGSALLPEAKEDSEGEPGELYIMGEYCNDMMGKYINLYYGSFAALAEQEDWTEEDWEDEVYTTLAHEFTHHIEGRAGERGLERKDEQFIEEFRAGRGE